MQTQELSHNIQKGDFHVLKAEIIINNKSGSICDTEIPEVPLHAIKVCL